MTNRDAENRATCACVATLNFAAFLRRTYWIAAFTSKIRCQSSEVRHCPLGKRLLVPVRAGRVNVPAVDPPEISVAEINGLMAAPRIPAHRIEVGRPRVDECSAASELTVQRNQAVGVIPERRVGVSSEGRQWKRLQQPAVRRRQGDVQGGLNPGNVFGLQPLSTLSDGPRIRASSSRTYTPVTAR